VLTGPDLRLKAIRSPGLPFNGRHPRGSWITTYLPTPEGWMAELATLVDP